MKKWQNVKKITLSNGRVYKVLDVVGDSYQVLNDGIVTHISMSWVIKLVAERCAIVE